MDPLPPLNKVYSLLIQEERQRSILDLVLPQLVVTRITRKARNDLYVVIVVWLGTLWTSAIKFMAIHQGISLSQGMLKLIKFRALILVLILVHNLKLILDLSHSFLIFNLGIDLKGLCRANSLLQFNFHSHLSNAKSSLQ